MLQYKEMLRILTISKDGIQMVILSLKTYGINILNKQKDLTVECKALFNILLYDIKR